MISRINVYGLVRIRKWDLSGGQKKLVGYWEKRNKLTNQFLEDMVDNIINPANYTAGSRDYTMVEEVRVYGDVNPYTPSSPQKTDTVSIFNDPSPPYSPRPHISKSKTATTLTTAAPLTGYAQTSFSIDEGDLLNGNSQYYLMEAGLFCKASDRLWARVILPSEGVQGLYKNGTSSAFDFDWIIIFNIK